MQFRLSMSIFAKNIMNFIELLTKRKSVRKFSDKPVEKDKIETLKKALLLSPTGKRKNHWDFVFVENRETLNKLAEAKDFGAKLLQTATLGIVVIGNPDIADTWIEDCSIASIIVQLEAVELGLGSCWVQISKRFSKAKVPANTIVKKLLNIPEEKEVLSIIAIGYPTEYPKPHNLEKLLFEKIHIEKY